MPPAGVVPAANTVVSAANTDAQSDALKSNANITKVADRTYAADTKVSTVINDFAGAVKSAVPSKVTVNYGTDKSVVFDKEQEPSFTTVYIDGVPSKYVKTLSSTNPLQQNVNYAVTKTVDNEQAVTDMITALNNKEVTMGKDLHGKLTAKKGTKANTVELNLQLNMTSNAKVNAAAQPAGKPDINAGSSSIFGDAINTNVNINAVAADKTAGTPSAISGNVTYTDPKGSTFTALLHGDNNNTQIWVKVGSGMSPQDPDKLVPGVRYLAELNDVTVNLGNPNANSTVTFTLDKNSYFLVNGKKVQSQKVPVDGNGVAHLGTVYSWFYAHDASDLQEVHFYSMRTGNQVTSGSVDLHAVNGKLSVQSVYAALNHEYVASQLLNSRANATGVQLVDNLFLVNDIKTQLEKQGIKVDANGYFDAKSSINLTMNAKSNRNGATASMPVTVNVDNVTPTAANESTTTKTIMHIATIYDKNGVATHEPVLRAYNSVEVVAEPVTLKDSKGKDAGKFYKLAGKDQYIKVGNVDGTKRTLKHNAYIYKSTGKAYMKSKKHHKVLYEGESHTTYGKSFMIAGHQMYRIGRNQYVKKANF